MPESIAKKFWEIKAEAGNAGGQRVTVLFYGDISMYPNYYQEDKSAQEIAQALKDLEASGGTIEHITARINSPGGSAFGGLAISNILKSWPAPVTTHVDGLAASAATLIFAAGDERVMPSNTLLFVHNPMSYSIGYASDMRKAADDLDTIASALMATYREIMPNSTDDEIKAMMDNETWITAEQALELGLATSIERMPVAASMSDEMVTLNGLAFDPAAYHLDIPEEVKALVFTEEAQAAADDVSNEDEPETPEETTEEPENSLGNHIGFAVSGNVLIVGEHEYEFTAASFQQLFPDLHTEISNVAEAAGIQAERLRQAGLEELAMPGTEAIIQAARASGATVEATAVEIAKALKASGKGAEYLNLLKGDAEASGANKVASTSAQQESAKATEMEHRLAVMTGAVTTHA